MYPVYLDISGLDGAGEIFRNTAMNVLPDGRLVVQIGEDATEGKSITLEAVLAQTKA